MRQQHVHTCARSRFSAVVEHGALAPAVRASVRASVRARVCACVYASEQSCAPFEQLLGVEGLLVGPIIWREAGTQAHVDYEMEGLAVSTRGGDTELWNSTGSC